VRQVHCGVQTDRRIDVPRGHYSCHMSGTARRWRDDGVALDAFDKAQSSGVPNEV